MLYRETLKFYKKAEYDEATGNYTLGDYFTINNLDVRIYRGNDANSSIADGVNRVVNSKQRISVRARKPFPLNHIVEWNNRYWKIESADFTGYEDKRRRHWFSARFIESGEVL